MVSQNTDVDIADGIPLNRATFGITVYGAGFEKVVDTIADFDLIAR